MAVDLGECRFDRKDPDRTLGAANDVVERIFAGDAGARTAVADGDVNRIRTIDDFANLDRADTGQAPNAIELQA